MLSAAVFFAVIKFWRSRADSHPYVKSWSIGSSDKLWHSLPAASRTRRANFASYSSAATALTWSWDEKGKWDFSVVAAYGLTFSLHSLYSWPDWRHASFDLKINVQEKPFNHTFSNHTYSNLTCWICSHCSKSNNNGDNKTRIRNFHFLWKKEKYLIDKISLIRVELDSLKSCDCFPGSGVYLFTSSVVVKNF